MLLGLISKLTSGTVFRFQSLYPLSISVLTGVSLTCLLPLTGLVLNPPTPFILAFCLLATPCLVTMEASFNRTEGTVDFNLQSSHLPSPISTPDAGCSNLVLTSSVTSLTSGGIGECGGGFVVLLINSVNDEGKDWGQEGGGRGSNGPPKKSIRLKEGEMGQ